MNEFIILRKVNINSKSFSSFVMYIFYKNRLVLRPFKTSPLIFMSSDRPVC